MKIAIYINNKNIVGVDCTDLTKGNPGIGGTEYCILLLAQLYKQFYPENQVLLIASTLGQLPAVDEVVVASGIKDVAKITNEKNADILVISAVDNGEPLPESFFHLVDQYRIKTIVWGHNFYLNDFCNIISNCAYVKANVFVGQQQYDRYVDHKIIRKSTYIYNMYPEVKHHGRKEIVDHSVTYIGSLVPTKGFHILAGAWKQVLDQVPDATLNIIGSGKLYRRNTKLGKYGIAEEEYENQFMPGLLNEKGEVLPSVHFLGVLGVEKNELIERTTVGIVNPSGRTETFGISALDFESLGVPVVTIAKGGFLDTVIDHETGVLYSNPADISKYIVELLENLDTNQIYGENGRKLSKKFEPTQVIGYWNNLFETVISDGKISYQKPNGFMNTNLKRLRCANRKVKDTLKIEYPFSVIGLETFARKMLRRMGR